MARKPALALVLILLLPVALRVHALGLGNIKLRSNLNQPLAAEIALLSARSVPPDEIRVRLASPDDFRRAGLERPFQLTALKFDVTARGDGTPYVRVTSPAPVREPFLNFLVELSWPNGRVLREYTVLLDPPTFVRRAAPPVAPAVSTPSTGTVAAHPVATGVLRGNSYEVARGDTLWSIARRVAPERSASVHQTVAALFRNNPHAFINGDINVLRAGSVLELPSRDEIQNQRAVAAAELQQPKEGLEEQRQRLAAEAPAQAAPEVKPEELPSPAASAPEAPPQAQLKLLTPPAQSAADGGGEAAAASGTGSKSELEALQDERDLAVESRDTLTRQNEELRQRMTELEQQLESLQGLVSIRDQELASLQARTTAAPDVAAAQQAETAPAVSPESGAPAVATGVAADPAAGAQLLATTPPLEAGDEPHFVQRLLTDPLYLGALGVVGLLLASLLWVVARRRLMRREEFQESLVSVPGAAAAVAAHPPRRGTPAAEPAFGASAVDEEDDEALTAALPRQSGATDPVAEAEVYMAYGRFGQAKELLAAAVAKRPDDHSLRLKLLEAHYATRDRIAFEADARELHGLLGQGYVQDARWLKAAEMGRELCPGVALFAAAPHLAAETAGVSSLAQSAAGGSLGGAGGNAPPPSAQPASVAESKHAEEGLDFDLEFEFVQQENAAGSSATNELPGIDFDVPAANAVMADARTGEPATDNTLDFDLAQFEWKGPVAEQAASDEMDTGALAGETAALPVEGDEVSTKLDLARAYLDLGDLEGAREILDEVVTEGSEHQQREAATLLQQCAQ